MTRPTNRDELLARLRELKPWLAEQGVVNLRLFGSFARDEAGPDSDVDLIVELSKPLGLEYLTVERLLGEQLRRPVEFCSEERLHHVIRDRILAEAIAV